MKINLCMSINSRTLAMSNNDNVLYPPVSLPCVPVVMTARKH